jgi:hypothetical protein
MVLLQLVPQTHVQAEIYAISVHEIAAVRDRFEFDWLNLSECEIFAIRLSKEKLLVGLMAIKDIPDELRLEIILLESSRENIGQTKSYAHIAGCLIAFACRMAFQKNYFGFVSLIPKTSLIEHYKTAYGFEQYGRHLAVDQERSHRLIDKYLSNEK